MFHMWSWPLYKHVEQASEVGILYTFVLSSPWSEVARKSLWLFSLSKATIGHFFPLELLKRSTTLSCCIPISSDKPLPTKYYLVTSYFA